MIRIETFMGMLPKVHPRLLPSTAGQVCNNARIRSGALVPFRGTAQQERLPFAKDSISKLNGIWQGWTGTTSVVPGPVKQNQVYISGDGVPKIYNEGNTYNLAVIAPISPPAVTILPGVDDDPDAQSKVSFVYTMVTALDEETSPSPLSVSVDYTPGQTVRINNFADVQSERLVNRRRIYRSVTSFNGSIDLFFIAEIGATAVSFDYNSETVPTAEPIPTADFDPPHDNLQGFTVMPNGMIAGFVNRELFFCEPYKPHAWPTAYSLTVDYPIVGLASFGPNLAVMTTGTPYIAQGTHPDNLLLTKIEQNLPCVSARGIVDLGYAAAYPSNDGLVSISTAGAQLITRNLFTRELWSAMNPSDFIAAQYEGRYAFLHSRPDSAERGLSFIDMTGETPFYITTETTGLDLFYELETGSMYVLGLDGRDIGKFDGETAATLSMTWRSKRFDFAQLRNFGAARLDAEGPGVSIADIYGNQDQIGTITGLNDIQRLKGGRLDDRFYVEISGTQTVTMFAMANGVQDLM